MPQIKIKVENFGKKCQHSSQFLFQNYFIADKIIVENDSNQSWSYNQCIKNKVEKHWIFLSFFLAHGITNFCAHLTKY